MRELFSTLSSVRGSAMLLLAAVFVSGGFAGAVYERSQHRPRTEDRRGDERNDRDSRDGGRGDRNGNERRRGNGLPWFFDSLNLSTTQRDSIVRILRTNRPRTDSVYARARAAALPEARAIAAATRAAIDSVLTPAQRDRLAKMPRFDERRRSDGGRDRRRDNDSGRSRD